MRKRYCFKNYSWLIIIFLNLEFAEQKQLLVSFKIE